MDTWKTAIETIHRCLDAGIREFVICAGARNATLIEALARAESAGKVRLWRHFEERSAGFFALGRTMKTAKPCAVVTTSGTAAAELLPAIIEAHYQSRPLVAITADRPEAFRQSGAPQAIVQPGIFSYYAHRNKIEEWNGKGPLHLNPELGEDFAPGDENFADSTPAEFEPAKDRLDVAALARWLRDDLYRGLVVMIGSLDPEEHEEVFHFCSELGAPVVAESTSGLREALQALAIHDEDRVLRVNPPGKVLRLGGVPSGRFWRDLEDLSEVSVWSVCRNGLPGLARASEVTRGPLNRVIPALGPIEPAEDALDLLRHSSARATRIDELLERFPDSEPALVRTISNYACLGRGLFLGNSLPIREWNSFAQWARPMRNIRANRGANGIDGQISTWLGWTADDSETWALIGDLTALYDLAAPFVLGQMNQSGLVLAVLQNHGGGIFKNLPRLASMNPRAAECMSNPHQAELSGLATLWGMAHLQVRRADDLDAFDPDGKVTLLEVVPDPEQTAQFWKEWATIKH